MFNVHFYMPMDVFHCLFFGRWFAVSILFVELGELTIEHLQVVDVALADQLKHALVRPLDEPDAFK